MRVMALSRFKLKSVAVAVLLLMLGSLVALSLLSSSTQKISVYSINLEPTTIRHSSRSEVPEKKGEEEEEDAHSPFTRVELLDIFLYSAIANEREPEPGELNIIITAFDSTGTDDLTCCMLAEDQKTLYTVEASVFFKLYVEDVLGPVLELFKNSPTKAKQYACVIPPHASKVSHVTLTSSACPTREDQYLPVIYPTPAPGGVALCAKTVFGDKLDPVKLVEWLEVQRLLGVDHVQLMDLHSPPPVVAVLRHYSRLGLLTALPYRLPGPPKGRGLDWGHMVKGQFTHDETFALLDCMQRLRGYTYVISHDVDEVIVPRRDVTLKEFFREQFLKKPDAAGFFFLTEFFVYDWGPTNTNTNGQDSNVTYFRYLSSTLPHDECKKYVCLTSRVFQGRTHTFTARGPYQKYFVDKEDAILHHYRKCPQGWSTCNPPRIVDDTMLRYRGVLDQRIRQARQAIGI